MSCVIGVPDPYQDAEGEGLRDAQTRRISPPRPAVEALLAYCRKHIAKYAIPSEIEFRQELPKTLVGKVAYRKLEEEEAARRKEEAEAQQQVQEETT